MIDFIVSTEIESFLWLYIYKQNISNEAGPTRPDFSRPILIGSYTVCRCKNKTVWYWPTFQSADWNRVKIDAAHVTIWSVDKNRTTKIVSYAPGLRVSVDTIYSQGQG